MIWYERIRDELRWDEHNMGADGTTTSCCRLAHPIGRFGERLILVLVVVVVVAVVLRLETTQSNGRLWKILPNGSQCPWRNIVGQGKRRTRRPHRWLATNSCCAHYFIGQCYFCQQPAATVQSLGPLKPNQSKASLLPTSFLSPNQTKPNQKRPLHHLSLASWLDSPAWLAHTKKKKKNKKKTWLDWLIGGQLKLCRRQNHRDSFFHILVVVAL